MTDEMMDLAQLAVYLNRDQREVTKLANRGHLPGRKVSGEWRFSRAEINQWLETQLHEYSEAQLTALEAGKAAEVYSEPLVAGLLSVGCIEVPLVSSTRASTLRELVRLLEQSSQVYDPGAILEAVRAREDMASTALESGVALPHPRRPLANALGESVLAYGRTASGIPFGALGGGLTDIFFLVCCRDEVTHLKVLARLARLFLRSGFLADLRGAEGAGESWRIMDEAERRLLAESAS
jgi:PTS system nitrogen regulatory IIA component